MKYFIDAVKNNYVNFSGRLGVKGYWMFVLFYVIFAIVAQIISLIPHLGFVYGLYSLALLLPSLAACVRRLQDTGKSWPWIFIGLIPLIGWIWMIVLLCKSSQEGDNQYGPMPVDK